MNPRTFFYLCLLSSLVLSCAVTVRAQQDSDSPAVSTVRIKMGGQTLVVTSHEGATDYEVDGGTLKAVSPNSSMTFTLAANGKILIGGGDTKMEVPEVRITRQGRTAFVGRIEGGRVTHSPTLPTEPEAAEEPFAEMEETALVPVRVQAKPANKQ